MRTDSTMRMERIERLLRELRYEVERGMLEDEIDEEIRFQFIVPISKKQPDGVVVCEFRTEPMPRYYSDLRGQNRLKIVKHESAQDA